MDRALREFRIRGVKTNIPFLENVVNHPAFQSGDVTTSFLDDDAGAVLTSTARRDRATKLLTYLADVIVNGNPEVANKPRPRSFGDAPVPVSQVQTPPEGTRQLLDRIGPARFAEWTREQTRLLMTDTTFRDAHQSLMATRDAFVRYLRIADLRRAGTAAAVQP